MRLSAPDVAVANVGGDSPLAPAIQLSPAPHPPYLGIDRGCDMITTATQASRTCDPLAAPYFGASTYVVDA